MRLRTHACKVCPFCHHQPLLRRQAPAAPAQQWLAAPQVLHETITAHAVSLLRSFADLGGHVSSSPDVADFLHRLTMELHTRVFDGPVSA